LFVIYVHFFRILGAQPISETRNGKETVLNVPYVVLIKCRYPPPSQGLFDLFYSFMFVIILLFIYLFIILFIY